MGTTGTCRVVVSGALSYEAADRLAEVLRWLGPGQVLLVDLTGAEEIEDIVLTQLASLLRSRCQATCIRFLGLGRRDVQQLAALGLHLDASGRLDRPAETPDTEALASGRPLLRRGGSSVTRSAGAPRSTRRGSAR